MTSYSDQATVVRRKCFSRSREEAEEREERTRIWAETWRRRMMDMYFNVQKCKFSLTFLSLLSCFFLLVLPSEVAGVRVWRLTAVEKQFIFRTYK